MYRSATEFLNEWKDKPGRKPLVVRGARQVGKSFLVRMFGESQFDNIVELNFERNPDLVTLFTSNEPRRIVQLLELRFNTTITPGHTLLFLDEIQAAPPVFAALRYFFEEMPSLHVIAAGSLLEFALAGNAFSVPVGRIEYLHLGPVQFQEFLAAAGEKGLADFIGSWVVGDEIPVSIHSKLMGLFKLYLVVGGMPAAVAVYVDSGRIQDVAQVHHSILSTYREDFGKYGNRVPQSRLELVFRRLPTVVGSRFKYVNVDREERSADLAAALKLLCMARVAYRVRHSPANGIPIGYPASETNFKMLFLDVGLMNAALGLSLPDLEMGRDIVTVHSGAVAEQFVGQHLLDMRPWYREPELHFWSREKGNSSAEIDYVVARGQRIVPVEVKAGTTGRLKSLHVFLAEKKLDFGVRFNSDVPSVVDAVTSVSGTPGVPFRLLSLPLYMVGQLDRLVERM